MRGYEYVCAWMQAHGCTRGRGCGSGHTRAQGDGAGSRARVYMDERVHIRLVCGHKEGRREQQ